MDFWPTVLLKVSIIEIRGTELARRLIGSEFQMTFSLDLPFRRSVAGGRTSICVPKQSAGTILSMKVVRLQPLGRIVWRFAVELAGGRIPIVKSHNFPVFCDSNWRHGPGFRTTAADVSASLPKSLKPK